MGRWLAAIPLLLVLAVAGAALFVLARGEKAEGFASPLVGKPAPAVQMPSLAAEAEPLSTAALAGRPYLINFFASWCAPCEVEHPTLMQLRAEGVPILGVAYKDAPAASAAFLARLGDPFVAVGVDAEGRAAFEFGVRKVPESFVVGADGVILAHHEGPLTPAFIERFRSQWAATN